MEYLLPTLYPTDTLCQSRENKAYQAFNEGCIQPVILQKLPIVSLEKVVIICH